MTRRAGCQRLCTGAASGEAHAGPPRNLPATRREL